MMEYFLIKKDPDAPTISDGGNFNRKNYPYGIDEKIFAEIDDGVAYYSGRIFICDILFEPTFLIHDRLQTLFKFLEPNFEFKGVQLYELFKKEHGKMPLYWLPYLPATNEVISEESLFIQGKPQKLVLDAKFLAAKDFTERRVLHCRLPAADIWLLSLEAAECLLRRQPVGIILEKVSIK